MADAMKGLHPQFRGLMEGFLVDCTAKGLRLMPYCGLRTCTEQARLFRQGRTAAQIKEKCDKLRARGYGFLAEIIQSVGPQKGSRIVTYAAPGESFHNYGLATDAVLLVNGKPDWNVEHLDDWKLAGEIAKGHGLEWAGTWRTFREMVHFQVGQGSNPLKVLDPATVESRLAHAATHAYDWSL